MFYVLKQEMRKKKLILICVAILMLEATAFSIAAVFSENLNSALQASGTVDADSSRQKGRR